MGRPKYSFRSPLTLTLLLLLRRHPLPTRIIAYALRKRGKYVSAYLSRLKKHGLVYQDGFGFWHLSDLGVQLLFYLENALSIVEKKVDGPPT